MNKVDMEVYHQTGGTYVVPTEIMNLLLDENENLNKGIDELLKKYESYILNKISKVSKYDSLEVMTSKNNLNYALCEIIQDLKKLKGE